MFKYLIKIQPLGLMYASAGGFLSPENLVGRSGEKFPPDAATLSGLILSAHKSQPKVLEDLRYDLHVAGPFWAKCEKPGDEQFFYVPMPRHKIIGKNEDDFDGFQLNSGKWQLASEVDKSQLDRDAESEEQHEAKKVEPEYFWLRIDCWDKSPADISFAKDQGRVAKTPWKFASILHPKIQNGQRNVMAEDGLFLEYAVQMEDDTSLIYLSTHKLEMGEPGEVGWYQFGGENHIVEISSIELSNPMLDYLNQPIERSCALIVPGVWGSNKLSYRYPKHPDFPKHKRPTMLTEKAVPYRYRMGHGETINEQRKTGRLSIGRYAVPAGSVYVFEKPLNETWWNFPDDWFPDARTAEKAKLPHKQGRQEKNKHSLLKKMGCGLCLPVKIKGVD
jgi:CRISPR-associated protein Cmr3